MSEELTLLDQFAGNHCGDHVSASLLIRSPVQHHLSRVRPIQLRDFPLLPRGDQEYLRNTCPGCLPARVEPNRESEEIVRSPGML